ncbi:MAG: glucose-1-phosphate adenylyltransferase [Candidatus Eiseniibacteriota bacterium]|nr:MAG: glucose-1-phosphate adenylyltransferase [Candidatus Eisenbacteria bacterium]
MKEITAVVLGGGRGTRLFPLTKDRSKAAVPFAGKYRMIDIPISNCINSEIRRIYVLTMYQSASLNSHIANTYRFDHFSTGFVGILAAEQTASGGTWFRGTADAVRQEWIHIGNYPSIHTLILSADHLYRMDYSELKDFHVDSGAAVTVAAYPVTREEAREVGVLKIDGAGRILDFVEKPESQDVIRQMETDTTLFGLSPEEAKRRPLLASMGIYLFDTPVLEELLKRDLAQTDFGRHIIPEAIRDLDVGAFCFKGYWTDIGTVRAFYEANMELVSHLPAFSLFDPLMPIYTHPRFLPGAKLNRASVECAVLCEGAIVDGAVVRDSILGVRARVRPGARIESSLVMGADFYQAGNSPGPLIGIGEGSHVRRAIIDKNSSIGRDVRLLNESRVEQYDDPEGQFYVRDGIIVVVKGSVIPDGFRF